MELVNSNQTLYSQTKIKNISKSKDTNEISSNNQKKIYNLNQFIFLQNLSETSNLNFHYPSLSIFTVNSTTNLICRFLKLVQI